ncbi:TRAP transporter substrate-binding protein [Oceanicola sp. S124]|uniref:TRAP transporter substrate-binding protein n=1 Tax=Oceanicola sp. S124 TaxID=1042378 RepID=UPI0002558601|nr:TRAP transporter substrate-binding protein [Oceanicola sp. S124]
MMRTVLLAATAATALAAPAPAQDTPVNLRFGVWVGPTHPLMQGTQPWIEAIEEASEGSIEITLYPSSQLGAAVDHYDLARDGIADITLVNPGYNAGRFPVISYGELPFRFNHAVAGSRALDQWYRAYAEQEMSEVKFCMAFMHSPGTIHTTSPVSGPEDLEGLSIRPANGTLGTYLSSLGATTIQASAAEMRDLLTRGTADGTASPYSSLATWGIADAATHHLDLPMYAANFVYVISPLAWNRMSAAQQAVMEEHCSTDWAGRIVDLWAEEDLAERAVLEGEAAHVFATPSDAQREAWLAAAEPAIARWRAQVEAAEIDAASAEAAIGAAIAENDAGL